MTKANGEKFNSRTGKSFWEKKKKNLASRGRWRKKKIRFFSETLCLLQVINM